MAAGEAGNTRLRSARQALGLRSQQQLAEAITRAGAQIGLRISVTERTVRRWESDSPPWRPRAPVSHRVTVRQADHRARLHAPVGR